MVPILPLHRSQKLFLHAARLLLCLLAILRPAGAQVVSFPDPNLEFAARDALGIGSPTNITVADMQTLTSFYCASRGITNLAGLDKATGLRTLGCYGNQIANLAPLAGLTNLLDLEVSWNRVTDVSSLAGLTNLQSLNIGGNRLPPNDASITNVSVVAGLKQLRSLDLYYLRVNNLAPLTNLNSLTNLVIGWNLTPTNVSALAGLTNLIRLHTQNNNVSNLTFVAGMTNLHSLEAGYNQVRDLSPLIGKPLTELWLYSDPLTNASSVTAFTNLTTLSLGGLGLTNASFLSSLTKLQDLALDGNQSLRSVPTSLLGLTNLWHLNLNYSAFTNLTSLAGLTNLSWLEIGSADLTNLTFMSGMTNLNRLDANDQRIGDLGGLTGLPNLNTLFLAGNRLDHIDPLLTLPTLYYLTLDRNLINTNAGSAAMTVITQLLTNFVNVTYLPQSRIHTQTASGTRMAVTKMAQLSLTKPMGSIRTSISWPPSSRSRDGPSLSAVSWPAMAYDSFHVPTSLELTAHLHVVGCCPEGACEAGVTGLTVNRSPVTRADMLRKIGTSLVAKEPMPCGARFLTAFSRAFSLSFGPSTTETSNSPYRGTDSGATK